MYGTLDQIKKGFEKIKLKDKEFKIKEEENKGKMIFIEEKMKS